VVSGLQVGLARTIYIRSYIYVYGIVGSEITIYTVIYGVYIRFWPTLVTRVTKMAYSPRLWLMAIGW